MRYLRSWLFDVGLMLIIAAPAAAYFVSSRSREYVVSGAAVWTRASYTDLDLRLPIGLAVSGLLVVAIAIRQVSRRFN